MICAIIFYDSHRKVDKDRILPFIQNHLQMDIALDLKQQEQNLIVACMNKERWAQRQLYETYYGKMMGVCLRYATNEEDARDILHEGFIKVFKNLGRYKPGTSLGAWIRRIMINTAIDFYRKSIRRRTEDLENAQHTSVVGPDPISTCSAQEIMKSVQQLSPAYRAVFNLYAIEGYAHKEIAEQLGISESTSRSNLVKARSKLKAMLASKYPNYGK
jgi:RNA polymerase sigma-70 factor (ECF subfamily)